MIFKAFFEKGKKGEREIDIEIQRRYREIERNRDIEIKSER